MEPQGRPSSRIKNHLNKSFEALDSRNFRIYFCGEFVSNTGGWMEAVTQSWIVYSVTQSELLLTMVPFINQMLIATLIPFGGILADRRNKREIIIITDCLYLLMTILLASLAYTGKLTFANICIISAMRSILGGLTDTTRQILMTQLVHVSQIGSATLLNTLSVNGPRLLGPVLSGILLYKFGAFSSFAASALGMIATIVSLCMIRFEKTPETLQRKFNIKAQYVELYQFLKSKTEILLMFLCSVLISAIAQAYLVILPAFATKVLHGNSKTYGILMGMGSAGAICGALTIGLAKSDSLMNRKSIYTFTTLQGLGLIFLARSNTFILASIAAFLIGYFLMGSSPKVAARIHILAEDNVRGKIMSLKTLILLATAPPMSLLMGYTASHIGPEAAIFRFGIACMVSGAILLIIAIIRPLKF